MEIEWGGVDENKNGKCCPVEYTGFSNVFCAFLRVSCPDVHLLHYLFLCSWNPIVFKRNHIIGITRLSQKILSLVFRYIFTTSKNVSSKIYTP
jgi:hypothetical protein